MSATVVLFVALAALAVAFCAAWLVVERRRDVAWKAARPRPVHLGIGFVTDFLDTLGIGSFAVTTSMYKLARLVDDARIPGTLNIGHAVPTFAEAFLFIAVVEVDALTLISMIGASVLGAWLGAGMVARWPRRRIQIGMGVLLLVAAAIIVVRQTGAAPAGGDALGLRGAALVAGMAGNFMLGALMTLGIGLYAPCMILVTLLGMNARTAFPIMMGSCAFLMPAASLSFVREGRYDLRAALGLTLGGVPGVLVAGLIVKSLPLQAVQWLVVGVVVYTAIAMLRSAWQAGGRRL
ncbi:MAG TPA: sulfite exporter TauE/SafE family protein [Candidatus Limnocylindrales bacterium]|nr:sulfite exporter TauE/SafE family protein [Candidatus Limnocylindrales bacterium]